MHQSFVYKKEKKLKYQSFVYERRIKLQSYFEFLNLFWQKKLKIHKFS